MADNPCPCGGASLGACCGPYIDGTRVPGTAEALMRSRYTAYALRNIAYLKETLWPKHQDGFDAVETSKWAAESHWAGLSILETVKGGEGDREGTVLFEAKYLSGGVLRTHRELSRFRRKAGRWY
ncbi:YchJ family protein [Roseibium aggregatum]|uniref:Zinc chelation protein SecC n=1 Tax=Roseibium aggregatum TaxID=187304 RepID=A0A939ELN3_9HYPH|nr:YchJ family metal-binding protein [Roseibium aggregatum]MBN9674094.1 zinc chelation protein SecC [Roseibium aggregatum]